jgi:hypothetical protein
VRFVSTSVWGRFEIGCGIRLGQVRSLSWDVEVSDRWNFDHECPMLQYRVRLGLVKVRCRVRLGPGVEEERSETDKIWVMIAKKCCEIS